MTSFINSSLTHWPKNKGRGLGFWHPCTCAVAVLLFICVGSVSCTMLVAATRWCCCEEELCTEVTTTEVLVSPGECAKGSPPGLPAVPFSSTIPSIALGCHPLTRTAKKIYNHNGQIITKKCYVFSQWLLIWPSSRLILNILRHTLILTHNLVYQFSNIHPEFRNSTMW